ncbi:hypothetical protein ADK74_20060 [Streptomyces decoyicus]|nr:hypothetical protein ADK74_20060 [Streptomyces decoyicus]
MAAAIAALTRSGSRASSRLRDVASSVALEWPLSRRQSSGDSPVPAPPGGVDPKGTMNIGTGVDRTSG